MSKNEDRTLENTDIKTHSSLPFLADHSFDEEEEEKSLKDDSSSGGSSPSDLRKRLQGLPSNQTAQLGSRRISRRLSRKRDLYLQGITNCIEESDERDEREDQDSQSSLSKLSARARRRAKKQLENIRNRTMGVSQPTEDDGSGSKSNPNNDRISATTTIVENKPMAEGNSEQSSPSVVEVPKKYSNRYSPLSGRSQTTIARLDDLNDSSRSERNSQIDRIELRSLSSATLTRTNARPTKFGGYRPHSGVILQNLSSGSEPETTDETGSIWRTDPPMVVTTSIFGGPSNETPVSSRKSILNSLFPREDSNENFVEKLPNISARKDAENSNDHLTSSPMSFYRCLKTPKSDSLRYAKDNSTKNVNQTFFSARNDTRYEKQNFQSSMFGTIPNTDSMVPGSGTEVEHYSVTNFEEETPRKYLKIYHEGEATNDERLVNKQETVSSTPASLSSGLQSPETVFWGSWFRNSPELCSPKTDSSIFKSTPSKRFIDRESTKEIKSPPGGFLLSKKGLQSSETISWGSRYGHTPELCSPKTDSPIFKSTPSKLFTDHESTKEIVSPSGGFLPAQGGLQSSETVSCSSKYGNSPELCSSNANSPILKSIPSKRFTDRGSTKEIRSPPSEIISSRLSAKDDQETSDRDFSDSNQREYANVPTLVLNSQELSPVVVTRSEKPINANDLIAALSNVSLAQRTNDGSLYSLSRGDSNTVSKPESSENNASDRSFNPKPQKSNASTRSFFSLRSKIPVKVSDRNRVSPIVNKFIEQPGSSEQTLRNTPQGSEKLSFFENHTFLESVREDTSHSSGRTHVLSKDGSDSVQTRTNSDDRRESKEETRNSRNSGNLDVSEQSSIEQLAKEDKKEDWNPSEPIGKPLSVKEAMNPDNLELGTNSADSTKRKYLNAAHQGDVCEKTTELARPKLQNRIGDGLCPSKSQFQSSSSTLEAKNSKTTDRVRFSLEKMAAEHFRRNICSEQTKVVQSETSAYATEKYEIPSFSQPYSSMPKLRRDSPRFRKSQDRFPFTISEKTSAASMKFKSTGFESLDEDSLERTYKLDMHPSITRLAGSGLSDTVEDIIYAAYSEREDRARSSGMRGLVQKFSARLRKTKKREEIGKDTKATSVIYENRDYREESAGNSDSESSLMKRFKVYENMFEKRRAIDEDAPEEESSTIPDDKSPNDGSGTQDPQPSSEQRDLGDRDDLLWDRGLEQVDEISKSPNECKIQGDPYSVFFVKSARGTPETSARSFLPTDKSNQSERKRNRVKFRGSPLGALSKEIDENVNKAPIKRRNFEDSRTNRNEENGCLCLRFYRMIIPISFGSIPKYRSRVNRSDSVSSLKKRFRLSLKKRKG